MHRAVGCRLFSLSGSLVFLFVCWLSWIFFIPGTGMADPSEMSPARGEKSTFEAPDRLKGPPDVATLQSLRERFTFEVTWGFLRIGTVHVYIRGDTLYRDTPAVHLVAEMISNRRIPLVGYKEVHYHTFKAYNEELPYGLLFWQNSLHRDMMRRYVFDFDYGAGYAYGFEEGELLDTLLLDEPADGGPAVMYYARLFAGTDAQTRYPIYIDREKAEIFMDFSSRPEVYESPAFPGETIRAYTMKGQADFDGPFGFSGQFNAWFRDDELRIPLEARVSIWIGSVRIRLTDYDRLQ